MKLILIRGLPGSGKSTLARELVSAFEQMSGPYTPWQHIEADMYFVKDGVYSFDAGQILNAHYLCKQEAKNALATGLSVIVSNTFSRIWEMQPYIDMAKQYGAELTVLTVEGNHGNIHGVPDEVIDKMKRRWERYDG